LLCIGIPLLLRARRVSHQGMAPYYGYFAAIGLAFLLVEISQLQRLSIFLGHPTAALTVVLFSMLLFSGIGSMLAEFFVRPGKPGLLLAPLALLLVTLVAFVLVTPWVLDAAEDQPTAVRFAVGALILMPISLLMGMPFSIGMRAATRREGAPTAFLWGINGAMSVCASVIATTIALFFGIFATFALGFLAYVAATLALWVANRRDGAVRTPVPAVDAPEDEARVRLGTLEPA
jgi:membrane protein YdbS with pleckstrin-like domain